MRSSDSQYIMGISRTPNAALCNEVVTDHIPAPASADHRFGQLNIPGLFEPAPMVGAKYVEWFTEFWTRTIPLTPHITFL